MAPSDSRPLSAIAAEIVGRQHVTVAPLRSVGGVAAALAVAPASAEEAAQVLQAATHASAAVVPWGGGAQQRIGAPPRRVDLVLETCRLDQVLEWEPADLTASLQSGMTLAAVQATLAKQGQQILIDAPLAETTTVGGLVATGTAGPRRWLSGGWRDQIIGMQAVLSRGDVIKSGGRVVKNVQGYDLSKLFTGSLGTLGVITQINVKVAPLSAMRRLMVASGELNRVAAFVEAVAGSSVRVSTLDILDADASRHCQLASAYSALVLIEGEARPVDAQSRTIARLAAAEAIKTATIEGQNLARVWDAWVNLERTDDLDANEALLTISTLPNMTVPTLEMLRATASSLMLELRAWARAGSGLIFARLRAPNHSDTGALMWAQRAVLDRWPSTTFCAGDPDVARAAQPWGREPQGFAVMRALKQRFDPTGTLQPGRFVGGI